MKKFFAVGLVLLLAACGKGSDQVNVSVESVDSMPELAQSEVISQAREPLELEWDDLVPADWRPDKYLDQFGAISDDDPRVEEISRRVQEMYDQAPAVESLNGTLVRIPGYMIPVDMDGKQVVSFLLVPYMGACIHTPPPPANQTIYVKLPEGLGVEFGTFEAVWVVGVLKVERDTQQLDVEVPGSPNDQVTSGYVIEATEVSLYE